MLKSNMIPESSPRSLHRATQGSLYSTEFDFSLLWNRVSYICNNILCWDRPTDFRGQKAIDLVIEAYTLVYRLVSCRCSDCPSLVRGVAEQQPVVGSEREATQTLVVYYLLRETLRKHLTCTVTPVLNNLINKDPHKLLEVYLKEWRTYVVAINNLQTVFSYVHASWQKCGLPAEHPLLPTDVLALIQWNESVLQTDVCNALSAQMRSYFEQDMVQPLDAKTEDLIKEFGNALVTLADPRHTLYVSLIEDGYVSLLSQYYSKNVYEMKNGDVLAYINTCLTKFKIEERRVHRLLVKTSLSVVMRRLTEILVDEQIGYLKSYMTEWIIQHDTGNLHKLYLLLSKSPTGIAKLKDTFESLVYERGMTALVNACKDITPARDLNRTVIHEVMRVNTFFEKELPAFEGNVMFENAMNSGLEKILKETPYVKSPVMLADELALIAHEKLKMKTYDFEERKRTIKSFVTLFDLLPSKKGFCDAYPKYLCQRLLSECFDEDTERSAIRQISRSKDSTSDFLHRCEVMLDDVTEKRSELWKQYSSFSGEENSKWEFCPIVLSSYSWTNIHIENEVLRLPSFIKQTLINFRNFYADVYPKRHVVFVPRHSRGILKMNLPSGARFSNLELWIGQHHLLVAECFNIKTDWSFRELVQAVGENSLEACSRAVMSYVNKNIMKVSGSIKTSQVLLPEHQISVVGVPNVKKNKIILFEETEVQQASDYNQPLDEANHVDASHTVPMKGPAIQANLIRILKAHGSLSFGQLLEQCRDECSRSFVPSVPEIKSALEFLIGRGFITREDSKNDVFTYIS